MKTYPAKSFNIPFYESKTSLYRVKLSISKSQFEDGKGQAPSQYTSVDEEMVEALALKMYVTYFFPEFYVYLYNPGQFSAIENADTDLAEEILSELRRKIVIETAFPVPGRPIKRGVICKMFYNVDNRRKLLKERGQYPDYEATLNYFNEQQSIEGANGQSSFAIGTLGKTNTTLNDGLKVYNDQMVGFEGQLPGPAGVDFNMLQMSTQNALNLVVTLLTQQLNVGSPSYDFTEADQLTIYFGQKTEEGKLPTIAISRLDYLLVEDSIGSRPMRVGYFSNIKYNRMLADPLTLATLKNYQSILDSIQNPTGAQQFSFFDFLTNADVGAALGTELGAESDSSLFGMFQDLVQSDPKKEAENLFINAAKDFGLIDINNTDQLEKGFKTAFTAAEIDKLKLKVADNPEVFTKVMKANQSKVLKKAADVTQKLDSIMQKGPMGFIDKNPIVSRLFREIGITDLAKEAMLCVTFGLNFEASRITKAIQKSLADLGGSLYYPPTLPRPGGEISKPKIDLSMFKIFSIGGDLHKQVLKVIIDTLQQTALEMIKKLAEMIKFACPMNNPRSEDFGANSLNDMIDERSPRQLNNTGGPLDQLAVAFGMTPTQLSAYLSALSQILSSMDICILFQDAVRRNASRPLIDRIIEFNLVYPVEYVNLGLTTPSSVITFFTQLSKFIDVSELCNNIANEVYVINRDSIDICLAPYDPLSEDALSLIDLMENGLQIAVPEINLDCPDKEGFLSDSTITVSIPEVFSTITQIVEMQFLESVSSVREILLVPRLVSGDGDSDIFGNMAYAGADMSSLGEMDPAILNKIIEILDKIASFDLSSCDIDLSQILGFDAAAVTGMADLAVEGVSSTLSNPEFLSAIEGIRNQLEGLSPPPGASAGPNSLTTFTSYRFNVNFLRDFIDYINMDELAYANKQVTVPLYFNSRAGPLAGETSIVSIDGAYEPISVEFNFPFLSPFTFGARDTRPAQMGDVDREVTGIGELDIHGNPIGFPGCIDPPNIVSRILWTVLMVTFGKPLGYNYDDLMSEDGTDTSLVPAFAVLKDIPTFNLYAPSVYSQLRFAGQGNSKVPLKQLTPQALLVIQEYFQEYGEAIHPIFDEARRIYQDWGNCTVNFTPDLGQYILNLVDEFPIDDLEITRSYLSLTYPRESPENPNLTIDFQSDGDFIPVQKMTSFISTGVAEQEYEEVTQNFQNVYVKQFVDSFEPLEYDPLRASPEDPDLLEPLTPEEKRHIESKHFPAAYATLVDRMFDYVVRNGVFDAATLHQLNLLPSPPDCPTAESGDLLDIEGIFEQMRAEYVEARCSNDSPKPPLRKTVRSVIKYGLYLLFIQSNIAEILVKNIFVLSAFRVDTILNNRDGFIFSFVRSQLIMAIDRLVDAQAQQNELTIRRDLVAYFNLKVQRQLVVSQGGIRYGDGRLAFEPGTLFTVNGSEGSKSFNDIIDYLIEDRLVIGRLAINNVLRNALPEITPLPLDEAFLASLPTYTVTNDTAPVITSKASHVFASSGDDYQVFMTRKRSLSAVGARRAWIKVWYYYKDSTTARAVELFRLEKSIPSIPDSMSPLDAILAGMGNPSAAAPPDCLDQTDIDQILRFGGTVAMGRGCPGTTHESMYRAPIEPPDLPEAPEPPPGPGSEEEPDPGDEEDDDDDIGFQ